jgi:hypothetical protein
MFVKSGPALQELLLALPPSLRFEPQAQSRTVTAGVIKRTGGQSCPSDLAQNDDLRISR